MFKMIDPHSCLFMTLNGQLIKGYYEKKELKSQGNIKTLTKF